MSFSSNISLMVDAICYCRSVFKSYLEYKLLTIDDTP